jgi:hypothetical protein
VPDGAPRAIAALAPDVAVLTEYVSETSHERFISQLAALGRAFATFERRVDAESVGPFARRMLGWRFRERVRGRGE